VHPRHRLQVRVALPLVRHAGAEGAADDDAPPARLQLRVQPLPDALREVTVGLRACGEEVGVAKYDPMEWCQARGRLVKANKGSPSGSGDSCAALTRAGRVERLRDDLLDDGQLRLRRVLRCSGEEGRAGMKTSAGVNERRRKECISNLVGLRQHIASLRGGPRKLVQSPRRVTGCSLARCSASHRGPQESS
jgi:hypothetical protein